MTITNFIFKAIKAEKQAEFPELFKSYKFVSMELDPHRKPTKCCFPGNQNGLNGALLTHYRVKTSFKPAVKGNDSVALWDVGYTVMAICSYSLMVRNDKCRVVALNRAINAAEDSYKPVKLEI